MLIGVITVSAAGILIGLHYKVGALVAATALLLALCLVWNLAGLSRVTFFDLLILVFALACAYVVGLSLAVRFGGDRD